MDQYTQSIDMNQRKKNAKLSGRAARLEKARIKKLGGRKKADEMYFNKLVSGKRGDKAAKEAGDEED